MDGLGSTGFGLVLPLMAFRGLACWQRSISYGRCYFGIDFCTIASVLNSFVTINSVAS